ncbi:hypothetical protein ACUN24_09115 [Pedobacter sp. WC2501]|uniref:hypothetical protein n=1 Tax=Pedobacter sp. WC2501 TaxID=3461400 RepID=UPI0040460609
MKTLEVTLEVLQTRELSTVMAIVDACGTVYYPGGETSLDPPPVASCCTCCCI